MWDLNIIAQKGLIFGKVKLVMYSGETINCNVPGKIRKNLLRHVIDIDCRLEINHTSLVSNVPYVAHVIARAEELKVPPD